MASNKGYKYSSYNRTVASTEYSLGKHETKSEYRRETGTEYSSARGATSTTREIISGSDTRTLPVYIAIQDYKPEANDKDGLGLDEGQIVEVLDNKNPASWLVRTKARPPQTGWAPGSLFESPAEYYRQKRKTREITNGDMNMTKGEEALAKRDTVFHELLRTEEEYVSQLHHLINKYVKVFDDSSTPAPVRQLRDQLTMNLRELYNFHANILLKGLQYYSDDPGKVGQTFVRLERDFDHHVKYCRDLPDAEKLLDDPKVKEFFDQIRENVEKDRKLLDYLRLPQARLQQYQQYIKELIKYTARAELSTESLQRALELMLSIPRRATDLNYTKNIQDYPGGDTGKLGRLLRHEQFRVWEGEKSGDGNLRYVFLFKTRLLFTERQDPEDSEELPEFKHVATIRLDKYEIKEEGDTLIFSPNDPSGIAYYLQPTDKTQAEFSRQAWAKEIAEAKVGLTSVSEPGDETETMTEFMDASDVKSEFSEYSSSRKSSMGPDEGPPRKKPKSPPAISPSASTQSLASSTDAMTTSGTLEMQGARVTRTQYGFRTLHESSAKMCLKVSGYPLPVITWFKDGVQLHEDERHKFYSDDEGFFAMTIDPVLVDDTGRYTCVATNEYGEATTSAFFRVVRVEKTPTAPTFVMKLRDVELKEGESAAFECEVEGWPEPEITFFVDGQAIHPSNDFRIEYDGQKASLKIRDVQPEDAGEYSIRLINELGVKESKAKLTVHEDPDKRKVAPEFQLVIEDKTVDEGDTVKFKALCTGDPEPEVTWLVNGHLLTQGENVNIIAEDGVYILTIKNVSTHFDGEVTCRAVNRLGDVSCIARLTVRSSAYEPSFEQELVDKAVPEGESVKFDVAIAAEPEPTVSWRLNGRELKPSDNVKIGGRPATGVYTLQILKVTPDLVGEIECHAENENGSAASSAKLSIGGPSTTPATSSVSRAPIIKQEFSDITVNVGDTLRLTLTTEGDTVTPVVRWLLNGEELKSGDGIKMKTEQGKHELVVENVTKQLAGTIECVVENDIGSSSCKAKVTVTEGERPPTFKAGLPAELPVETGQSVKIKVDVDSKQPAKVTWLLNGKDVKDMPDHFIVTQDSRDVFNLEILDVTTDLSGEIECRLETVGGKSSSKMKLIVSEPPPTISIAQPLPESVAVKEGETLKLEFRVQSDSGVKKPVWTLNGKEIKESSNVKMISETEKGAFKMIVHKVTTEFSGVLVCKIQNRDGDTTETRTEVNVKGKTAEELAEERRKAEEEQRKAEEEARRLEEEEKERERQRAEEERKKQEKLEKKLQKLEELEKMPTIKQEPPKEVKTTVGEPLEIVVVADPAAATATWELNGKELKDSANVKKISDTTGKQVLQISEVTTEMSGVVTCTVENNQGAATATTKVIVEKKPEPPEKKQKLMEEESTVEVVEEKMEISTTPEKQTAKGQKPKILSELQDTLVSPNEPLKLELKVSGDPPPKVTWTLNGKEIVETADIKITSTPDGVHTLEMPKAKPEFTGQVVVKAENEAGSTEAACQVAVVRQRWQAKPEFQSKIPPITVAEGDTLRVRVLITGDPDPRVKWYINDRIVVETEDTQLLSENGVYTMEIQGASTEMIGKLKCVAYNSRGEVSQTAPINVTQKIPVEFEQYLCDTICREGDTLKLKAVLLGEPEPVVNWYVNGRKLEESQNIKVFSEKSTYIVVIKDITLDYAGEVVCKAVNEYGEASSSALLTIAPRGTPPDFTEWLSNVSTKEGATIKHRVVFTGDPTPKITWYVNNEEVKPTDDDYVVTIERNVSTLTIKKFKQSMVGEVICKAENDAGEVSCTAQMNLKEEHISEHSELEALVSDRGDEALSEAGTDIHEELTEEESIRTETPIMAPKFITKIKDIKVKKGQQAIFECVVPDTKGVCVKWLKDGNEIELIARIRVKSKPDEGNAQFHQLIIESVKQSDSGLYTCIVSNEVGEERSAAVLEIAEEAPSELAPEFTKNLQDVTVIEGAKAILECAVAGLPTPTVEWYKDGKRIKSNHAVSIESTKEGAHRLVIRETTVQDAASYEIQISNKLGSKKQEAKVIVQKKEEEGEKPSFVTELRSTTVVETEEIRLECKVTGKPTPDVKWFKNEKDISKSKTTDIQSKSDGTQILSIQSSTIQDSGEYRCEATNNVGTSSTKATVTVNAPKEVEEKPSFSQKLVSQTVEEGETVTFRVSVSGKPKPTVKFYKDGKEVKEDATHKIVEESEGVWKLEIQKSTTTDVGEYKAEATNAAGKTSTEANLVVKKPEPMEVEKVPEETAPEFVKELPNVTVTVGETATLECAVVGQPTPEVKWMKDGKEIKSDARHIIESEVGGAQKLIIADATKVDIGEYTCKAISKAGKAETVGELDVKAAKEVPVEGGQETAPEFVEILKAAQATEGDQAVLQCRVIAQPAPSVKWFKDGEELKPSDHVKIESQPDGTQRLVLKDAKTGDTGEYRCEAANEAGTAWTEGPLTVKLAGVGVVEEPNEVAPDFVEPLRAQRAQEGEEVRLECKVTGVPPPEIRWFKDGAKVEPSKHVEIETKSDGTQILVVHAAKTDDVGEYRCEAANVAGKAWSDATLTVQSAVQAAEAQGEEVAPQFAQSLHAVQASEGQTATFECQLDKATAALKPEVHWYKDGKEVKPSEHVKVESAPDGTQRLVVKDAAPEDIGEYKCEVVTKEGQAAETHAPLSVAEEKPAEPMEIGEIGEEAPPEFAQELKEVKVNEGDEAIFECKVSGFPRPEVKWFKDGKELKPSADVEVKSLPDGTEQLIIHKAKAEDQGNYRVSATNVAGSMSSKAPLTVQTAEEMEVLPANEAPQFTEPLHDVKANEGTTAQLECVVTGTPQPKVVWYKDNKPVQAGPRHVVENFIDGRQRLTIYQARGEDIGSYQCVALSVAGKAETEADVKVEEKVEEPAFSKGLKNVKVKEGETVQMACQIAMKNQKRLPEIKWYKNGGEIKPDKRVAVHAAPDGQCSLIIHQATEEDAGTYVCAISNTAGESKTEATVTVEASRPPEFTGKFEDITIPEGSTCVLETTVSGLPFPEVKWLKDGKELRTKGRIKIQKDEDSGTIRLVIEDAQPEDEGTYRCTLTNDAGTASAKAAVTVEGKMEVEQKQEAPRFVKGLENQNAVEGNDVTLTCTVAGVPFPEVFWFKGGVPLKPNGHYDIEVGNNGVCILRIKNSTPDDTASYTVKIINPAGQAESVADVYVEGKVTLEPPAFTRGLEDRTVSEKTTVVLEVEVNTTEVFIKWLRNGQEVKPADAKITIEKVSETIYRLTIHSASVSADSGEYTATATNEAGTASTSGRLTVEKSEELIAPKFRRGLQDQTTKPGVPLTLEIEVEGKPKEVKWYKGNNELQADKNIKIEKVDDSIYRLTIPNVSLDDAGDYSVEVSNDQGTAKSDGKVAVEALKFPTIVKGLQDVQADEGAKAVFEVEVSGKPKTVKWYKNGKEVSPSKLIAIDKIDDAHYRLTVESASPDDVATYRVEAGNEAGTVSSEAALTIKKRVSPTEPMEVEPEGEATLTIVKGLEDQQVNEGQDVTLEVQLSAAPALLKWYKGGKELKADTDKRITLEKVDETIYRLTISGTLVDDTGNYKVVASNAAGTVGSEAKVAIEPVAEKPNIVKGLRDTEAPEGDKVALEIEVLGKPKQVKWYKNGKELWADQRIKIEKVDDTHYRLTISDVKKDDEASYKVETSNDAGTDSSEAALTVKLAEKKPVKKSPSPVAEATLTIVRGLEDEKADEGLDVTFEVELSDKPTSFKWFKGGTELAANKRIQIERVSDKVYRLTVSKVQIDDGGTYKFEASNAAGTVASSAKLFVQPQVEQPKIIKGLKNADVEEGATATFEVEVSGKPKSVKWFKNGKELSADERIKIEKIDDSHFKLTVPNTNGDDEATYRVELGNDAGTADSEASLTVRKPKPKEERPQEPEVPMEAEATLTVVKPLEDQIADDGDNVAFDVELSDKPKTVKWYKNGQIVKPDKQYRLEDLGDNKFRLLITGVSKDEEAAYKVEASNDSGTTSSEAKLTVKGVAPRFRKGLEDKSATAGVKIVLEVEVEGKPNTVEWYKNGKELKSNKRTVIEKIDDSTYRLTFTAIEKDDAGPYRVEASNDYGTASSEGTLAVEEPPKKAKSPEKPSFSKPLADKDVEEGTKVTFDVEVLGKPKTVKWYKNGREIKPDKRFRIEQLDDKSYRLVIGEATKEDEATYKVEASNDAGTVDSQAALSVHPPKPTKEPEEEGVAAKFVVPLRSETVPEDQSVSLTCKVKGTPFPEVAWLKDNVELEASEHIQIIIGDDGKCELLIQEAKADDAGTYTCLAQNVHGGDRTKCTLNVETKAGAAELEIGEPPEFVKPLRNKTVIEGEDLVLEVKIVGKPMPEVCWYKNGDEIMPSERVTGQIDCISDEVIFRLHIKNARLDDTHTYKCVAHNIHGEASSSGKITVESLKPAEQAPAKFVLPLQDTSVVEGKTAIFDVKVRGRPTPELAFYKDRKEISESPRVHIEDLGDNRWRLTIENVSSTDAGLYEARCTNSLGSDLCQAHLAVQPSKDRRKASEDQYPPVFNVPLHDRRVPAGNAMTVECYVDAKPRAQIKWYKGDVPLDEDDRVHVETYPDGKCRLRVLNFLKEDEGLYKCVATNDLGTASTHANLTVEVIREEERITKKEYAPFFTRELSDRKVAEGTPFTLECQVDGVPTPDIRWFKDGVPLLASARIQIEHLDDGTCRLTVPSATTVDMGAYRCVASNRLGASNSVGLVAVEGAKAEKKKEGEAPMFLKGLTDVWIEKGTPFTLRCQVTGDPRPEVKWYKDGTIVRGNDRIDIAYSDDGTATLTVQDSSFADEGFYRCVAENPLGSANSIGTVRVQALKEKRQITLDEGEAPKFVVPLEDWSCSEGSNVEFDCKVTGKPAPTLKWYKDGAQLLPDHRISFEQLGEGRYRVTIQGAKGSDEGTYRCVATNEAGAATSKAQLTLEGPSAGLRPGGAVNAPSFAVPLRDVRAVEGNPIVLECKLNGEPLPDVKWYKDGELLVPSDRIKIDTYPDGTARLLIEKSHPGDEGIYRVVAENPSGTANSKANVSVKKAFVPTEAGVLEEDLAKDRAPKVIVPLESESSKEGLPVTLSCRITGTPTPTIHWFKDGEPLYPFGRHQMEHKPDGTIHLRIDQLVPEDAGCYRCVAENDLGTARTTCQLTVESKVKKTPSNLAEELARGKAPGFLTPLTVKRVPEGATVVFECLPYGNPFPVIKWLKDGVELGPSDRITIESLNDNTQRLTLHEALVSDEGFYRCVASNEYGTSSTKAELIVEADLAKRAEAKRQRYEPVDEGPEQESKPRFRRGLRNLTVNQGSPAEFEVAIAGNPAPTVKWFKNGEELENGDRVLTWQDEWGFNRLVVLNAQSEDEAEYSVEATNKLGSAKSECSLHVLKDRYTTALAGEEALPTVGTEAQRGESDRRLFPPGFLRQIKNKHVFTGFPAIFDCIVTGNPTPDVVWYHNGKPIQPDGRIKIQKCGGGSHALVIFKTVPEDEGEYVCKAGNSVGTATSSAVLEVTVPLLDKMHFDGHYDFSQWLGGDFDFRRIPYAGVPSPPDRGPFIAEVTGHYLTLSWIPTRRPPPRYPQISYIVEMRELPDKEWVVVDYNIAQPCCKVRNMELGKSYQFRVRAENIYGISEPSPPSPPSQLMAPPRPVLDKRRRPIPLLDPYAQEALSKAYGDQYACAPWFAPRATDKTACAVHGDLEVIFFVYGFPDPEVKWYFRGWEIDSKAPGSRFETKCYGGTECVLKIRDFQAEDAGQYQCMARNIHGEAQQHIFVELASLPTFLQPLENRVIPNDRPIRLDCRIDGNPYPEVKWYKDWHPIVQSSRVKLIHEPPYLHSLQIQDPILRDTGIYTCTAVNEAGKVSSTATVTVQAEPSGFEHVDMPARKKPVLLKPRKLREFYEIEEEPVQKDPRFTVHRVTEKATGRKFLAKIMPGKARGIAQNEIDLWNRLFYHPNLPCIWDAFDDGEEVAIVYENITGGGLLDRIVSNERVPETRIAFFMRQLLQALEHMHNKNIVHMDLKPENIMLSENGSDQIKLTDFGLSRRLRRDKPTFGVLGAPEFVSPEVVAQRPVSLATDMWSVGVLAYVMLSGKSPFLGDSDAETLANVANARWSFDPKLFDPVSAEAKDFISKLLVLDPKKRLDVQDALAHPWVQLADSKGEGELLTTQFLKEFKYRHQWVERRIFVQYGNEDDEDARAKLFTGNLEWLEPTYFPLQPSAEPHRVQIEATLPLPPIRPVQRPLPTVQIGEGGKREEPRRKTGEALGEIPDFDVYVSRGERRPIEDELASRILSDISEEGSMISEEAASKASRFSMESLIEDRLGEANGNDMERTPTNDDYPTSTIIKVAPGAGAQLTVEVDEEAASGKPGQKSPVRVSPTKEETMKVIVTSKGPRTGIDPEALLPLQRSAKLGDHDFEQIMANAERVKEGIRQRLKEGKPPSEPLREINGHARPKPPARPLTDFDVPCPAYELDDFDWDSQYQMGPETFLLQLRDAGMAARVRDYRRYLYGDSASYVVNGWLGDINNDITLRERRRYTDLIKNNKDLQEAARDAARSTEAARVGAIKRSRGIQSTLVPAPMITSADGTHSPIFQTRLKDTVFAEDGQATFHCIVLANPPAEIVWYHNDAPIMLEAGVPRHTMTYDNHKAVLAIKPALAMDAGTYKCLAKNSLGESFSEAKLRMGDAPDRTSRPDVELASDTEVFITWEAPASRSGSDILGYKLEFRRAEEWTCPWFVVSDNLDEEAVVVRKLEPLGIYQFKVTPRNTYGWGEASLASRIIQTHGKGAPKLNIELLKRDYHLNIVNLPQSGALGEIPEEGGSLEGSPSPSERREQAAKASLELNTKDDPKARFQLESEIFRGRFCLIRNAVDKQSESAAHCVAKVLMANLELRRQAMKEYEALREIQHEHVVSLLSAYLREDFLILFLEKLSDNLIERFTYNDYYTEEHVARVMSQLLSALQWIHFKKFCHLDLQPDNIMFTNKRSWNLKVLDAGTAVRLDPEKGEAKVERLGAPEYAAPEVLHTGCVTPAADIWGIGLLSYLLLSGTHPFMADDPVSQEQVVRNIVLSKLDLNFVYTNASQEALRFMTWALKKQPGNRMNTEEGLQHRWLSFHETMIRRRENIRYSANRLRTFARTYIQIRRRAATNNNQLLSVYGGGGDASPKKSSSFTHSPTKRAARAHEV